MLSEHLVKAANGPEFIAFVDGDEFLQYIVAGDQTWCHHFQPEGKSVSMQWKYPDLPRLQKLKAQETAGEMILTALFDLQRFLELEF
ncbi:uncharacterized protein TNCT_389881 [Trichonephila clavata]|uniref:Uncharacterized protein n=1 Tax=Trichonephila clavata TaxID=2740835 RepID=A0A8X6GI21_TRICU|nr:uncharacterized protein TNCT_389881 [Trichonephila clavata]